MDKGTLIVQAWGAAAVQALVVSHDIFEAATGWIDRLVGLL